MDEGGESGSDRGAVLTPNENSEGRPPGRGIVGLQRGHARGKKSRRHQARRCVFSGKKGSIENFPQVGEKEASTTIRGSPNSGTITLGDRGELTSSHSQTRAPGRGGGHIASGAWGLEDKSTKHKSIISGGRLGAMGVTTRCASRTT